MTEIILALDVDSCDDALDLARPLRRHLRWVKLGLQLFTRHGPGIIDTFAEQGFKVFLDLKLHDIPNTVVSAIKSLRGRPCTFLTLHTLGGPEMLRSAVTAAGEFLPDTTLLGVTVLTSMDTAQLTAIGVGASPVEQVKLLAQMAAENGLRGFVCSPWELAALRAVMPRDTLFVTPGIRSADAPADDQRRTFSPAQAARLGASYIVVGRPILRAPDPVAAIRAMQQEIANAG
ncbi:MAG: orotidine-5'-phosphate decarboxylase [Puniceicoccales bacterium]|nr:orotidine-5'-phosphate decarboxylase [Puniceicoccales bacterium]